MTKKIALIFGTRPEIIKLSPLIALCRKQKIPFFCIHTGQHYSYEMDKVFFEEIGLPLPKYQLKIRSRAAYRQGEHTGKMLIALENILLKELPKCVVVQGDTTSVLAGSLAAEKLSTTESYTGFHIKVAHVEAGLRSFDRSMPEEVNRIIADNLSDYLFVPTQKEKKILLKEGMRPSSIFMTGNTIVDAVKHFLPIAKEKSRILKTLGLSANAYFLLTLHRQENVDNKKIFTEILQGLKKVGEQNNTAIIFPMHPRTAKMVNHFNLQLPKCIKVIHPVGFLDFLWLEANARLALTDSGGVQEETCIMQVPCVTIRDNTERPETISVGSNILAGRSSRSIPRAVKAMLKAPRKWNNPFGNGRSSEKILKIISS